MDKEGTRVLLAVKRFVADDETQISLRQGDVLTVDALQQAEEWNGQKWWKGKVMSKSTQKGKGADSSDDGSSSSDDEPEIGQTGFFPAQHCIDITGETERLATLYRDKKQEQRNSVKESVVTTTNKVHKYTPPTMQNKKKKESKKEPKKEEKKETKKEDKDSKKESKKEPKKEEKKDKKESKKDKDKKEGKEKKHRNAVDWDEPRPEHPHHHGHKEDKKSSPQHKKSTVPDTLPRNFKQSGKLGEKEIPRAHDMRALHDGLFVRLATEESFSTRGRSATTVTPPKPAMILPPRPLRPMEPLLKKRESRHFGMELATSNLAKPSAPAPPPSRHSPVVTRGQLASRTLSPPPRPQRSNRVLPPPAPGAAAPVPPVVEKVKAKFDYTARSQLNSRGECEVSMKEGDTVAVLERRKNWLLVRHNGKIGVVPANYTNSSVSS